MASFASEPLQHRSCCYRSRITIYNHLEEEGGENEREGREGRMRGRGGRGGREGGRGE